MPFVDLEDTEHAVKSVLLFDADRKAVIAAIRALPAQPAQAGSGWRKSADGMRMERISPHAADTGHGQQTVAGSIEYAAPAAPPDPVAVVERLNAIEQAFSCALNFLERYNPCMLAEGDSQQWLSAHDQMTIFGPRALVALRQASEVSR